MAQVIYISLVLVFVLFVFWWTVGETLLIEVTLMGLAAAGFFWFNNGKFLRKRP